MAEDDERQPLIHPNPNWGSANNHTDSNNQVENSGEYTPITPTSPPGIHRNRNLTSRDFVHAVRRTNSPSLNIGNKSVKNSQRSKSRLWNCNQTICGAGGIILMCVILERLAFYGFSGNLVLFLNKAPLYWESYNAITTLLIFFGLTYIMSLLGGWLADTLLGRFKALVLAFSIYFCGMILMPFLAATDTSKDNANQTLIPKICAASANSSDIKSMVSSPFDESCSWLIYITLLLIAIGCGVLKANICPFGSDQVVYLTFTNMW